MKQVDWLKLFAGGLLLAICIAILQPVPGYMDAEYYYAGGLRIANNLWRSEPFLWNYLDNPVGLPHASFSYWMPIASVLAAGGMRLTGNMDFSSARIPFILLSGLVPLLTAKITLKLGSPARQARLAGWLAVFSGFYALYTGITETFSIYMVLGCSLILVLASDWNLWKRGLAAGAIVGLMHLTRADGFIWLGAAGLWIFLEWRRLRPMIGFRQVLEMLGLTVVAYLVITSPWYLRNLGEWGSLMPPGGNLTLWLTDYNQTYSYPVKSLTFATWWNSGLKEILLARGNALWLNFKTLVAVQGSVALLPLILIGGWRLRRNLIVQTGGLMWLGLLFLMTISFPFSGSRGGFFHSGAAVQPLLWALAAIGLDQVIEWGSKVRGWRKATAWKFFATGLVVLMAFVTIFIGSSRLFGTGEGEENWSAGFDRYQAVESWLRDQGGEGSIVMVNNPPGYYVAGRRAAIVIPYGNLETVKTVAERYGAVFLVLEKNSTPQLKDLFMSPHSTPGLTYLAGVGGAQIFQFEGQIP
jgi:hypothetical protein